MPPEIDDVKPKNEPLPLIDLFSFHQGPTAMNDKSNGTANKPADKGSIDIPDPYGFHQGLNALSKSLIRGVETSDSRGAKGTASAGASKDADKSNMPEDVECKNGVCRQLTRAELAAKRARLAEEKGTAKDKGSGTANPGEAKEKNSGAGAGEAKPRGAADNVKRSADTIHVMPNPFEFHQGADKKPAQPAPSQTTDKTPAKPDPSPTLPPFDFHQGDKTPVQPGPVEPPRPFTPPSDVKPIPVPPPEPRPDARDKTPAPTDISDPNILGGKSSVVAAYERRQGARHAGNGNNLPPIDAIPGPNDLTPPVPGPRPNDLTPPPPGPRPNDLTPPPPGPRPSDLTPVPRPEPAPWVPPKIDDKPAIKPVDHREELISKLEPKYETSDVATAVKMAKDLGLPLAVHIGAEWCGYCVQMERNTWPSVEGTADRKGSMQGKVVVLHVDIDHARNLRGENAKLAQEILRDRGGSVPLLRVFKVDEQGGLTKTAENHGAINSKSGLEQFLIKGGVKR